MATTEAATVELPLTAAMRQLIGGDAAADRRKTFRTSSLVGAVLFVLGLLAGASKGDFSTGVLAGIIMAVVIAGPLLSITLLVQRRQAGREAHESHFLRTMGPIRVTKETRTQTTGYGDNQDTTDVTTYKLVLPNRQLTIDRKLYDTLTKADLSSGTVEYTKHGLIFDIRNEAGEGLYRHQGYVPESAA